MDEVDKKEFKKIALRFLKEAGLYKAFFKYILYNDLDMSKTPYKGWYDKKYINSIFGDTYFTQFIEKKYLNRDCGFTVTSLFKAYLEKKYPGRFKFSTPLYAREMLLDRIDTITDIIKFNNNEKEKQ